MPTGMEPWVFAVILSLSSWCDSLVQNQHSPGFLWRLGRW